MRGIGEAGRLPTIGPSFDPPLELACQFVRNSLPPVQRWRRCWAPFPPMPLQRRRRTNCLSLQHGRSWAWLQLWASLCRVDASSNGTGGSPYCCPLESRCTNLIRVARARCWPIRHLAHGDSRSLLRARVKGALDREHACKGVRRGCGPIWCLHPSYMRSRNNKAHRRSWAMLLTILGWLMGYKMAT